MNGSPAGDDPAATLDRLIAAGGWPDRDLVAGIAAYRRHPSRRTLQDPAPIWAEGAARLLDYGPGLPGRPILFVPSLVNRGYILDLAEGHSLMRYLAAAGIRPLLLDWGWPGARERRLTLTDHVAGILSRAITAIGRPLALAGYCMGGLLAVAATQLRPEMVQALVLLATPWDFHAGAPGGTAKGAPLVPMLLRMPWLQAMLEQGGAVPVDVLQALFALADPQAVGRKFRRFAHLDQDGAEARLFVAIEDWVNDGIPLAAPVARGCFTGWYGANEPARGEWLVAGAPVTPQAIGVPCLAVVPGQDRIVPPASAWPLVRGLRQADVIEPAAGHVGMVAGARAETVLWRPLRDWLRQH